MRVRERWRGSRPNPMLLSGSATNQTVGCVSAISFSASILIYCIAVWLQYTAQKHFLSSKIDDQEMDNMLENFIRGPQSPLKSLFHRRGSRSNSGKLFSGDDDSDHGEANSPKHIPQLSPFANSVVARCSKVLLVPVEQLQYQFDTELPDSIKQPSTYARNLLEFCSYQAIHMLTRRPDYLSDKEFSQLTFDMMLAWEDSGAETGSVGKETPCSNQKVEDEDGWSLFYSSSTSMAVQVDDKKTVGPDAFARIAPACAAVADVITVHNLFYALTSSSCHQLHFLIYDKYLRSLDKVIKASKNALGPSISGLQLTEGEIVLDVDGTVPTQPVLQHIGISAWPGRLTLTNYALYFESFGVGSYDKAVRYDLATDMKQVIKPELTGPLGARLFDKAIMYQSTSIAEPVYLEFPEIKGNSRRDYWLDICLEILHVHRFIRKYNLKDIQQSEALARAILGIFRYRAAREAFRFFSSQYKTLLAFNLAESLPGGDTILEALSRRLAVMSTDASQLDVARTCYTKKRHTASPFSLLTLRRLGLILQKVADANEICLVGDICVGEMNPLEMAVKRSKWDTGRAEAAQATVDRVKVDGIDTNLAVMKDLLFPVIESAKCLQSLASWEDPLKSAVFLVLICYATYRDWIRYALPSIFSFLAVLMLWHSHFSQGKPLEAFKVTPPPSRNPVEQLLTLQQVFAQFEALIQDGNIFLLKIRALVFAVLPQATERVSLLLVFLAATFAFVPLRYVCLSVFFEAFTREMPLRKDSSDRWLRRVRDWWFKIPAAPVQLVKFDDKKKTK
ncbi:uncharacterized protein LOC131154265 [Malania oleifera]|uniref:uncharacterized protein LOC131154265 n=1 Tax=Malania oleifera TaxID=397392 RepID=UPI0025ADC931|nr:uncharacterized protein LOC131154265 [Malania oleifera]